MLRYNRWFSCYGRKITRMLFNSCSQLSLCLSHIRGLTIVAWNFVYDIIARISFNPIFVYFNKTSEIIESSMWRVLCEEFYENRMFLFLWMLYRCSLMYLWILQWTASAKDGCTFKTALAFLRMSFYQLLDSCLRQRTSFLIKPYINKHMVLQWAHPSPQSSLI